ncbi:SAF domain-containing protein [Pseudokineococcus lusitanus]|uniref:SAF domain-containing protein n=1 Tax=Pseudokineococcus lusitanus TaxID=763993 RepID=A0A3N1HK88_9ACTN|nr:SAF domain-containing protein [Pseudokineococcus lusitanus]ROP42948.1 SAF domain-containing protein [Pseudokineococcus lusitanus]
MRPTPPAAPLLLAAAADLPAGHVLAAADLVRVPVPAAVAPAGALGPADDGAVLGARLTSAVRSGELLTDARLGGPGLLVGAPAGQVALAVPVGGATGALVRAGDAVDVLAPPAAPAWDAGGSVDGIAAAGAAVVVARGAVVLDVPAAAGGTGLLPAGGGTPGVVVLAVARGEAAEVAAVTATGGSLVLALLPPAAPP